MKYEIHVGEGSRGWIARCYYAESGEHVWSSEEASSAGQALREIGSGIERKEQSYPEHVPSMFSGMEPKR